MRPALSVWLLYEAEIVTLIALVDDPGFVAMLNDAEVAPAGIVTEAGTVAEGSLLDRDIPAPPPEATGPVNVIVPVEPFVFIAVVGDTESR